MASVSVDVDVDLEDFDLDDLLDEISDRYIYNKSEIDDWALELLNTEDKNRDLSIIDKIKIDLLLNNLEKIKLSDLENLI